MLRSGAPCGHAPVRGGHAKTPCFLGSTAPVVTASLVGLAALVCKTARAGTLAKDKAGRFRFATSDKPAGSSSDALVFADQPGVCRPWGFYDPLNFCNSTPMVFPEDDDPTGFHHLRNAELKHGRFAMMAATGSLFACFVKFPGFESIPSGLAALETQKGADGFGLLFLLIGAHELATWRMEEEPISYQGLRDSSPELVTKELNNGRLAMFAFAGQIAAELVTGENPAQQFGEWAFSYPKFV